MRIFLIISILLLAGCNVNPHYDSLETYFHTKGISSFSVQTVPHCHGYGCKFKQDVTLNPSEWNKIKKPLKRKTTNAQKERANIAKSIKIFEQIMGAKTGTHVDVADTFKKIGDYQLDCADESTNTSLYLKLLEDNKLLRHHKVLPPTIRGLSSGGLWLHETALIQETKTEKKFAVDAWWRDNGEKPYVVPLEDWKNGWKPEKKDNQS